MVAVPPSRNVLLFPGLLPFPAKHLAECISQAALALLLLGWRPGGAFWDGRERTLGVA